MPIKISSSSNRGIVVSSGAERVLDQPCRCHQMIGADKSQLF